MANLGNLVVSLEANMARFTSDMGRAAEQTERAMQQMQGAANITTKALGLIGVGLSVDALVGMVNKSIDALAGLDDMAQKTGSSIEELSKLSKVAAMTGADFAAVDAAIVKLAKGMSGVDEEGSKAGKALAALGLSTIDLAKQDPSMVFVEIAKKLQDYEDGAGKAALMTDLLGKSGANLLPYLNDVAESIDKFTGDSKEAAAAATKYQDSLGLLRVEYDDMVKSIVKGALPAMSDFIGALDDTRKATTDLTGTSTTEWTDDFAVGLARVVDVAILIPAIVKNIAGSFKSVYADITVLGSAAKNLNPYGMVVNRLQGKSPLVEFQKDVDARNKVVEEANNGLVDLWNIPANRMEQAVLGRIAGRNTGSEDSIDAMGDILNGKGKRKPLKYSGADDAAKLAQQAKDAAAAAKDAAAQAKNINDGKLKSLEAAMAKEQSELEFGNKYIAALREQDQISLATYNDYRQRSLDSGLAIAVKTYDAEIAEAERYRDTVAKLTEKAAAQNKVDEAKAKKSKAIQDAANEGRLLTLDLSRAQGELNKSMEDWNRQQTASAAQLQFNNDLYGKSVLEIEKLTTARRIELDIEEKIRAAKERGAITDESIAAYRKASAAQLATVNSISAQARGDQIGRDQRSPGEVENERHANELKDLRAYQELKFENIAIGNQRIEEENRRHADTMLSMQMSSAQTMLNITQDSAGQLYAALKAAGMEQTALGKAMFYAQKAIQVASIIVSANVAAAAAQAGMIAAAAATAAVSGPAGPGIIAAGIASGAAYAMGIRAMGYASAGIVAGTAIASAEGGYDIPAGSNPVTQLHEKEMVLPKAQADVIRGLASNGGKVGGGGSNITINQTVHIDSRSDQASIMQAMTRMKALTKAEIADDMARANH